MSPTRIAAMACMSAMVGACAGQTSARTTGSAGDAGVDGDVEADAASDAIACVFLTVTPADLACSTDLDCTSFLTGRVCPGACFPCGSTPVNVSAAARFAAQTASFPMTTSECGPCAIGGEPYCAGGQCAACFSPGPPDTCDAGSPAGDQ